jgi:phosphosulfolactate phosphohydrolase-like enzyme
MSTITIDIAACVEELEQRDDAYIAVVVEPLYGCTAVASALDAGWDEVEIAPQLSDQAPIPLISFDAPRPRDAVSNICRVRATDLEQSVRVACRSSSQLTLLASLANARPFAAQLALRLQRGGVGGDAASVVFVPARTASGAFAADAWWVSGVLIRLVLDELLDHDAQLRDAAGLAVTIATEESIAHPGAQLAAGARWLAHVAAGGSADDARRSAAFDCVGIVPQCRLADDGLLRSTAWIASAP